MVLLEGIAVGWLFILAGAVLLLIEIHNPGFFAAVPATVLLFMGILLLIGVDIFSTGWGILIGVVIAICAGLVTVWAYGKMTTDENPTTISRDTLIGKEGRVKVPVNTSQPVRQGDYRINGMECPLTRIAHHCGKKGQSRGFRRSSYCC